MAGFGDDSGFNDWLTANGYSLPSGAPTPAVLRERGSSYIDATYGARFKGVPTGGFDQERSWPRSGAVVNCSTIPDDVVPLAIVNASYRAAWVEANAPGSLSPGGGTGSGVVKRQKVDTIEREFFEAKPHEGELFDPLAPSSSTSIIPEIDNALKPYLRLDATVQGVGLWSIGPAVC